MRQTPRPILTAAQMRAAEERAIDAGTSVDELMDRAGQAVAEAAWRFGGTRPVLILCGPGNNGGDGYVAARYLKQRGARVRVAATGEPGTAAAINARRGWDGPVEALDAAEPAPTLIDSLFGTGLSRPLDDAVAAPLARLVAAAHFAIAVDVPSGLATDDGALLAPVPHFGLTLALGSLKPAHRLQPAASHCGKVIVGDIGIVTSGDCHELGQPALRVPGAEDHKYSRGLVAVIAGSLPGAARLSATAAIRAGAGYVRLHGATGGPDALVHLATDNLDTALDDARIGAVLIGPGLGRDAEAKRRLAAALASGKPLILDADALHLLGKVGLKRLAKLDTPAILTPHSGEFAALFGKAEGSKVDRTVDAARRTGAIIVHKGADTVIAAPDGTAIVAPPASSWLSTAGTGDVLAGVIAAMRARGMEATEAAGAGVWLQADAARRAGPAFVADDLASYLPGAIAASL
ncbi:NAD(P)H-hydrate dehydratase [Sphingomonas cavernae]|uniref:Bifunctional NAD(P)H-hydrate repair enzyme n=1 Tax=Sphingomonas cavernae TaxID=2320861 RepID=A0A418W651_9SPHN|nr:NAD(P)H-hydrate dehydratase [Sphingomonas cavernae]RJF85510.1 NAD(P)H-hydrate dehydratase [Sphingomonas cavernae]